MTRLLLTIAVAFVAGAAWALAREAHEPMTAEPRDADTDWLGEWANRMPFDIYSVFRHYAGIVGSGREGDPVPERSN